METIKQLLRGEPLAARAIVLAVLTAIGVKVSGGTVDAWVAIASPILLTLISRHKVTPAANPGQPTTIAVKQENGEVPADLPPVQLPPILTVTGQRR
jgi:hypothetical protein